MIAAAPVHPFDTVSLTTGAEGVTGNRLVRVGVQAPARGLVIAVNLRPDRRCNFACLYCPVDRQNAPSSARFNLNQMAAELRSTLDEVRSGTVRLRPGYCKLPAELVVLRHVVVEGDGEPTLAPEFLEAIEAIIHLRAQRGGQFFKLVLRTNGSRLDTRPVQAALEYFTRADEVWIKLDAGTQDWMDRINRPDCTLERVLTNIAQVSQRHPVVIQTTFSALGGQAPPATEIGAYIARLRDLRAVGSQIAMVRLHSAGGLCGDSACRQIPLRQLSEIARQIRMGTGLRTEVH